MDNLSSVKKAKRGNGGYPPYTHIVEKHTYDIESLNEELLEIKDIQKTSAKAHEILSERLIDISSQVINVAKDMEWIKKYFWLITSASVGTFITLLVQFIFNMQSGLR